MAEKSLAELLREPPEVRGEELVECAYCGEMSKPDGLCPKCGEFAVHPTMGSWGKRLPLGIEENGKLNKDFDLTPLNWKLEREIGRAWETKRDKITLGEHIGTILSHTVTRLGSTDLTKHTLSKKQLIFNQMYAGDVFYMYAYLRLLSLGKELKLRDISCDACGHKFEFVADITTLELVVRENIKHLRNTITLRDGFQMAGDRRTQITIRPITWSMMDSQFVAANLAETFFKIVASAVEAIEGLPAGAVVTEKEVEQFTKYDMALLEQAIDRVMCGPRWDIAGECPQCQAPFTVLLDWSYQNFFAISYRSPRLMRR